MTKQFYPLTKEKKGAALTDYGILTGLIAVVAIGAIIGLGGRITNAFDNATNTTQTALSNIENNNTANTTDEHQGDEEETEPSTDPNCYLPSNIGTVGEWNGCLNQLIVDNTMAPCGFQRVRQCGQWRRIIHNRTV